MPSVVSCYGVYINKHCYDSIASSKVIPNYAALISGKMGSDCGLGLENYNQINLNWVRHICDPRPGKTLQIITAKQRN